MSKSLSVTGSKEHLLQVARAIRDAAGPKVHRMIERLCEEAETAERDTARVTAARAVVSFAIESSKLVHEIESGESTSVGGTSVTVLVATPNGGDPRLADGRETRSVIDALSESVRLETAKLAK